MKKLYLPKPLPPEELPRSSDASDPASKKKRKKGSRPWRRKQNQRSQNGVRTGLRHIRKGVVWLITKKTNDDLFLLRPDKTVKEILLYLLLLKLNQHGLLLHAFIVMSDHIHLVVTDVRGRLPKFMGEFLGESGKALKIELGPNHRIWSPNPYSAVELLDRDAAERLIAYCHTNPTKAGLTLPADWPGLTSAQHKIGDTLRASKAKFYFGRNRPDVVEGRLSPLPPMIGDSETHRADHTLAQNAQPNSEVASEIDQRQCEQLQSAIDRRVEQSVGEILEKRANTGMGPLAGCASVLSTPRETQGNPPTRGIKPRFATTNRELMKSAKAIYRAFCVEHYDAKERYIEGETKVWFPHGTYGYRELLRVQVRKGGVAA